MRLAIIDPGYSHSHSHHQAVNLAIQSALKKRGVEVLIIAAADLDIAVCDVANTTGLSILPYFTVPCYPANAESLPLRQHEVLVQSFAYELLELFRSSVLQGTKHFLLHTGFSFHIAGIARAIWFLDGLSKSRLLISMMFHPGARIRDQQTAELDFLNTSEYLRYKKALWTLQASGARANFDIALAVPCRTYMHIYKTIWQAGTVEVHPALGYIPLPKKRLSPNHRSRVMLYLGGPKEEKGIEFAARLGVVAAKKFPQAEFVFHYNDQFPGAARFASVIDELRRAGEEHRNVVIFTGNIDARTYNDLFLSCQIFCLLYNPEVYSFKTSGIFWDALRCEDADWLITAGTWPEEELKELHIPHAVVDYNNVSVGVVRLGELLHLTDAKTGHCAPGVDVAYLQLLNSSFGDWLYHQFTTKSFSKHSACVSITNPDYQPKLGRILVVRTRFEHFSQLSGPGGFITHLRSFGYEVDEVFVSLGSDQLESLPTELKEKFTRISHTYLNSYQGNAVLVETDIQRKINSYDIVHFLDAEHCGLLNALYRFVSPLSSVTKLVATYHQPQTVMEQIVANPYYLNGFDCIHLMSPCQERFFKTLVNPDKLCVVPHGLSPELLEESLPTTITGLSAKRSIPGLDKSIGGRKVILTVGNWQRDFNSLQETAKLLLVQEDVIFVLVSKGLRLDTNNLKNVLVLNQGVTDSQLHALYRRSTLLFLPLHDSAANNAILEAMAHGLPIVTTDLPSTRYYTNNKAVFVKPGATAYAAALQEVLTKLKQPSQRMAITRALRQRASELVWKKIAITMHEKLYSPLLTRTKGGQL